jgi:hypothetical protein
MKAAEVQIGTRIRARNHEVTVTRIDQNFLGRDNMALFVEDTAERWACIPLPLDMDVEVL